jgi:HlyD family secretion protein
MTGLKIRLLGIGMVVIGVFAWVVMTQGPLASIKVTVEQVQVGELSNSVFGVGVVKARRSFNLAPTMTSRIRTILVDQGDHVVAGQVLAEMDPVDLDEKFAGSQRVVEKTANAILAAEAQLAEAESRLKTTGATYARYEDLRTRGFVSQDMFDAKLHEKNAAESARAAAAANLASARDEHARAQADSRGIGKARAQTRLVSPTDGVIAARLAEPGSTVVGGQVVLQVVDPGSLWVETRIDQHQAGLVRVGQATEVILRSRQHAPLTGKVARVDMVSDAVTEERIVNVSFPVAEASIGEYAEVTIRLPKSGAVRSIPTAAVKRIDGQTGVWVLRDGVVEFKPVKAGISTIEGRTQIVDGLDDGESVIVYSQQPMRVGIKVKVVSELVRG